jgi:hypothetical protein
MARHEQVARLIPQRVGVSPERLFEENLILKKEINSLQQELYMVRAKLEVEKVFVQHYEEKKQQVYQSARYPIREGDILDGSQHSYGGWRQTSI